MILISILLTLISKTWAAGITLFLYKQLDIGHPISPTNLGLFEPDQPTIVLADGFTANYTTEFINATKKALFKKYFDEASNTIKHNIVVLDWSYYNGHGKITDPTDYYAIGVIYLSAAGNVSSIGVALAEILAKLPTQDYHLIGHSLSGHLVGYTGRAFNQQSRFKIRRITGLDSAGPGFESAGNQLRKGDAIYTEIFHSNGKVGGLGVRGHVKGDLNVFLNGGQVQPNCVDPEVQRMGDFLTGYCNHAYSHRFYVKTINEVGFGEGCPCDFKADEIVEGACRNKGELNHCRPTFLVGYHGLTSTNGDFRAVGPALN